LQCATGTQLGDAAINPNVEFWRGKRVLVTGHTGFKGAWLAMWLRRLGARPAGFALAPDTTPNLAELSDLERQIPCVRGDIRDQITVRDAMAELAPEIVFHLAAQSLVRTSYQQPVQTFETNVLGTIHVMEGARITPSVQALVVVTSDKCYENREWLWPYREDEPLGGYDPYSASKACAEIAVAAWRRSFLNGTRRERPLAVASARAGNVIGGGDWSTDRLIPDCVRAFATGAPVQIRNTVATRPWQHVLEPLSGYLLLAERLWQDGPEVAEAWNFGPTIDDVRPVGWVVDQVVSRWGDGATWVAAEGQHPHEAGLLAVDASKARARLRWHPRLPLAEALSWTVEWYKRQLKGEAVDGLVGEQIERYERSGAG
jgi:CDP-glucose 4,6-dehydratase